MLAHSIRFPREHFLFRGEFNHLYDTLFLPLNLQSIRWKRKPRWLPTAPSKLYKIPQKIKYPPEEEYERRTLYNHYRTEMKSLRSYFNFKIQELLTGDDVLSELKRKEEEDHDGCLQLNEEWNKKIATLREERIAKEKEEELENIVRIVEENRVKAIERKEQLEALVRKEKELSKFYITPENIDEAIEKALSKEVDYNYSIDLDGNIYRGRNAKPVPPGNIETKKIEDAV